MGAQADTYYSSVESKLSEHAPGPGKTNSHWWLMLSTARDWFPGAGDSYLGLQFKRDASQRDAEAFEKLFDRIVEGVSFTKFRP